MATFVEHQLPLEAVEFESRLEHIGSTAPCFSRSADVLCPNRFVAGQSQSSLEGILQLAHVAWPGATQGSSRAAPAARSIGVLLFSSALVIRWERARPRRAAIAGWRNARVRVE